MPGGREDDTVRHWQAEIVTQMRRNGCGLGIELHNKTSLNNCGKMNGIYFTVFTQVPLEHLKNRDGGDDQPLLVATQATHKAIAVPGPSSTSRATARGISCIC